MGSTSDLALFKIMKARGDFNVSSSLILGCLKVGLSEFWYIWNIVRNWVKRKEISAHFRDEYSCSKISQCHEYSWISIGSDPDEFIRELKPIEDYWRSKRGLRNNKYRTIIAIKMGIHPTHPQWESQSSLHGNNNRERTMELAKNIKKFRKELMEEILYDTLDEL